MEKPDRRTLSGSAPAPSRVFRRLAAARRALPLGVNAGTNYPHARGGWRDLSSGVRTKALALNLDPARRAEQIMVGTSAVMMELRSRVTRIAATAFTVLIEGESGAGKE